MPVTKIGLVSYADGKVFRKITPTHDDSEITTELCYRQDPVTGALVACPCGDLLWRAHVTWPLIPFLKIVAIDSAEAAAPYTGTV